MHTCIPSSGVETGPENWGGSHYIGCQVKIFSLFNIMHLNIENKISMYYGDFMLIKKKSGACTLRMCCGQSTSVGRLYIVRVMTVSRYM